MMLAHYGPLWSVEPMVMVMVMVVGFGAVYLWGYHRMLREAPRSALRRRATLWWFVAAFAVLVVALGPPLDPLAAQLFSVHMVQHLLLSLVFPLLLMLAAPLGVMAFTLPPSTRHRIMRSTHRAGSATGLTRGSVRLGLLVSVLFVVNMWLWHIPKLYDEAVRNDLVHGIEHLTFLVTGVLLMWGVVGVGRRTSSGVAILQLFVVGLPMGALAAILTLTERPLYSSHLLFTHEWGLTPLQDQQLAGAIMWVPGGIIVMGLALVVFIRWLGEGPSPGEQRIDFASLDERSAT